MGARRVVARAPTRIDLGGGWTDVPPYCDNEGGYVCNVAIARYAVATLTSSSAARIGEHDPLVRAVLRDAGLQHLDASLANDFPFGAGLGGSSAASAAVLGAVRAWRGELLDPREIAEAGRRIEVDELGIAGGRQDHYAATHGGALGLTFPASAASAAGTTGGAGTLGVTVQRLAVPAATLNEFVRRSLLVYTGESRISGDTITAVLDAYRARNAGVLSALERMKSLARQMAAALEGDDLDALGVFVGEHWAFQRSLHPAIPTARIDAIVERSQKAGALGAKAMGASGGGCVLVLCGPEGTDRARAAIADLGSTLDFAVDTGGVRTTSP